MVKGRSLWQEAGDAGLSLLTDPACPTRRSISSTRDSVPDLAFVKNAGSAVWSNLFIDPGSDHYITATSLQVEQKRKKAFSVPDWDKFREVRKARGAPEEKPENLVQWFELILQELSHPGTVAVKRKLRQTSPEFHVSLLPDERASHQT
ncbi:hypothetical protein HPB49_007786 [Dermacentor silvarum]|uniref:Uncharacterized protein n=1 Tax=Dermacentor silvarum TaxID=543639 RepID=A0ACB8DXE1_DERSI|nr:hypothetical protein HPB49_007786 [Dermacentor silvarum]